jgi:hypothetical protein
VWINTPGDDTYWQDGSYIPAAITGGQKVSYANGDHSAIALSASLYESKWGDYPLMRHAPGDAPYNSSVLNGYQLANPPLPALYVSIERNNTGGGDPELIYPPSSPSETLYVDFYNTADYTSLPGVTYGWLVNFGGGWQTLSSDPSVNIGFNCAMAGHTLELKLTISAPGWQTSHSQRGWFITGSGCS